MVILKSCFAVIITQILLLRGCDLSNSPIAIFPLPMEKIYFNSFETPHDSIGVKGFGFINLRNDAPQIGGKKSLLVSGGCLQPHAYFELPSANYDRLLILRCWGKNLATGGNVTLSYNYFDSTNYPIRAVSISVQDTVWKFYQTDTLHCPAGKPLFILMNAGGFHPSIMLVDLLEVLLIR